MGYDFVVEYKKEIENQAADALSRVDQEGEEDLMLISFPTMDLPDELKTAYTIDVKVQSLILMFNEN